MDAELSKEVPRDGLRNGGDGGRRSVDWSLPPMKLTDETLDNQVLSLGSSCSPLRVPASRYPAAGNIVFIRT